VASCSLVSSEHRGMVVVSGSYGGNYNAYNAAKWRVRGVIMNDAGIGKDSAGIRGLEYLDRIELPGATADTYTCHIGDGDDTFEHGLVSHVNQIAANLGCKPSQTVRECAKLMLFAAVSARPLPDISEGRRFIMHDVPGQLRVICVDTAGMIHPDDTGQIVVTGSHAALSGGKPDDIAGPQLYAVFFSDAGVGKDRAGIARLWDLDRRGIAAGAVSANSAPIGDSRAIHDEGILSHVNEMAARLGGRTGMPLKLFIEHLIATAGA
jgi:hypothetical protein